MIFFRFRYNRVCKSILHAIYFTVFFTSISCASSNVDTVDIHNLGAEYYFLAEEYISLQKYDKALELLQKVQNTGAKTENELFFAVARTAALAKNWDMSLTYYEKLLLLDSQNTAVQKSIAWVYAQKGDIATAQEYYEKLYARHNYDKDIATNYIFILLAAEYVDEAKIIFEEYSQLYPDADNLEELENLIYPETADEQDSE